jgi:glycine dehydrogenase subunit 1
MSRYTAVTEQDLSEMLATIGVGSIDELFAELVPEGVKLDRELGLPEGMTEQDVYDHLRELAAKNVSTEDEVSFLGAGMYDTYVPAIVDMLTSRSEFLTPYTPYQPEVSQGSLQVMFEYQTAISELTGLPVSNASVYEGPSALAAAGYLAKLANGKGRFVISRAVHPHSRETLVTLARGYGVEVVEVGMRDGVTDPDAWAAAIDDDTSAVFFQQPNFLGAVEDAEALAAAAKNSPAVVVAQVDALTLGVLAAPGECGVDVAVGEGQQLGNRLDFGGPVVRLLRRDRGLPAPDARPHRRRDHRRRRPARLRADAADARAAHPPREGHVEHLHLAGAQRAGRRGLPDLARPPRPRRDGRAAAAAHRLRARELAALDGVELLHDQPPCASSPCGSTPTSPPSSSAAPPRASTPATRWAATTRSSATACSSP